MEALSGAALPQDGAPVRNHGSLAARRTEGIEVRPLQPGDHSFIHRLAREQDTFSSPTEYMTWMYAEVGGDASFVATMGGRPVGYLLGQITRTGTFWLWQIATEQGSDRSVALSLLVRVNEICRRYGLKRMTFTMYPKVAAAWGARAARRAFGADLVPVGEAINGECLYEVRFQEPKSVARLHDLPGYAEFLHRVFLPDDISIEWSRQLGQLKPRTVLEIGAGHGRRTRQLLQTRARVTALEWEPALLQRLASDAGLRQEPKFELLEGHFPGLAFPARFDCIVLGRHVLHELLSDRPSRDIVAALDAALAPGGAILFDYPADVRPDSAGTGRKLFHADVADMGRVAFEAFYEARLPGPRHLVQFTFAIDQQKNCLEAEIPHPPLQDLISAFGPGKSCSALEQDNAGTFLPAATQLVIIRNPAFR